MKTFPLIVLCCAAFLFRPLFASECAPFYCSMESVQAISDCNGTVNGSLTFPPGVNGNASSFDGTADIHFTGNVFNSSNGSVSLWFRKNSADEKGGIIEIGQVGTVSSLGIFYNSTSHIYFDLRNANNDYRTVCAADVISQSEWTHIVVIWDKRDNTYHMKLFINGRYISGGTVVGPFSHIQGYMNIGVAGAGEWYGRGEGIIDELRFFDWALSDGEVYGEYVYSSHRYNKQPTTKPVSTGPIKVQGKSLTVNGAPFTIKGVGYQPIPIGMPLNKNSTDFAFTNPDIIQRDVNYLTQMNVNTVRLWAEPPDTTLLDALADADIYVIMPFEIPSSADDPGIDYGDPTTIAFYKNRITAYVNQFKNHPAVLLWAIGNENNLHYTGDMADWYRLANELAHAAYDAEKPNYHPTAVINGYMLFCGDTDYSSDDASLDYVDIWGHNSYTRYDYHSYFCYYDNISAKPLIITEFGVDAYDMTSSHEYQDIQAEWVVHEWQQIENHTLGGTVMEFCDEKCKCKYGTPSVQDYCGYDTDVQPDGFSHEEWYGIMATADNDTLPDIMHPRKVYCALRQEFSESEFIADLNADSKVNLFDFAVFASYWLNGDCLQNNCCGGTDLDCSGTVDSADLLILAEQWLGGI